MSKVHILPFALDSKGNSTRITIDPNTGETVKWSDVNTHIQCSDLQDLAEQVCNPLEYEFAIFPNPDTFFVDFDVTDGATSEQQEADIKTLQKVFQEHLGVNHVDWDQHFLQRTKSGGAHYIFRGNIRQNEFNTVNEELHDAGKLIQIDIRAARTDTGAGGLIASGKWDTKYKPVDDMFDRLANPPVLKIVKDYSTIDAARARELEAKFAKNTAITKRDIANIQDAIRLLNPSMDYNQWSRIGWSLASTKDMEVFGIFDAWSRGSSKYEQAEVKRIWNGYDASKGLTIGTFYAIASENGWSSPCDDAVDYIDMPEYSAQTKRLLARVKRRATPTPKVHKYLDRLEIKVTTENEWKITEVKTTTQGTGDKEKETPIQLNEGDIGWVMYTLYKDRFHTVINQKSHDGSKQVYFRNFGSDHHTEIPVKNGSVESTVTKIIYKVFYENGGFHYEALGIKNTETLGKKSVNMMITHVTSDRTLETYPTQTGVILTQTGYKKLSDDVDTDKLFTLYRPIRDPLPHASKQWKKDLDAWADGDQDWIEYVQRLMGGALSGRRTHNLVTLLHGAPDSGKSMFLKILSRAIAQPGRIESQYIYDIPQPEYILGKEKLDFKWGTYAGQPLAFIYDAGNITHFDDKKIVEATESNGAQINVTKKFYDASTVQNNMSIFIACNSLPMQQLPTQVTKRLRIVPFTNTFKNDPNWEEARKNDEDYLSTVLAWLIEGALKEERNPIVNQIEQDIASPDVKIPRHTEDYFNLANQDPEEIFAEYFYFDISEMINDRRLFTEVYKFACAELNITPQQTKGKDAGVRPYFEKVSGVKWNKRRVGGKVTAVISGMSIHPDVLARYREHIQTGGSQTQKLALALAGE